MCLTADLDLARRQDQELALSNLTMGDEVPGTSLAEAGKRGPFDIGVERLLAPAMRVAGVDDEGADDLRAVAVIVDDDLAARE